MAYEQINGERLFKSEAIKLGDRFYLAKITEANELIPQGNPLKKSEFILAQ